jgi:hypothetical protein
VCKLAVTGRGRHSRDQKLMEAQIEGRWRQIGSSGARIETDRCGLSLARNSKAVPGEEKHERWRWRSGWLAVVLRLTGGGAQARAHLHDAQVRV